MAWHRIILPGIFLILFPINAPGVTPVIPELLKPWQDWVLHGHEEQVACTPSYRDPADLQCDWPSALKIIVDGKGATFSQDWLVQHERWIQLPGSPSLWPGEVRLNDRDATVLNREDTPRVQAGPGTWKVTGKLAWTTPPEHITIPPHTGLIKLVLYGTPVDFPHVDRQGRLWLQTRQKKEGPTENRLLLRVFRLLEDSIPFRETVLLKLDVSGNARVETLPSFFPDNEVLPLSLSSPLPARLQPDGSLKVQVRPGRWNIRLTGRHTGPVTSRTLSVVAGRTPPGEEIWSVRLHPNLRVVELSGAQPIDPGQTALPEEWRKYPSYRLTDGMTLHFREIKRGDPHPAPDRLSLDRNIWLRFDGSGYTLQDTITGSKTTGWRLEMNPPIQLGRVALDGREQFITRKAPGDKAGVELRKGILNLTADSVYSGAITSIPAVGWDHDFQKVRARLFLPPGWRLIYATGIDNISGTWVKRWDLLDFFVVLICTIAVIRLFSVRLGILAFVTLVLLYHEPGAPRWVWLAVLAGTVLLRHLPEGRFRTAITIYCLASLLVLVCLLVPFSIQQIRTGIYPQLEKPAHSMGSDIAAAPAPQSLQDLPPQPAAEDMPVGRALLKSKRYPLKNMMEEARPTAAGDYSLRTVSSRVAQYDPAMVNQTGPGLPGWRWNTLALNWSGPVRKNQKVTFFYTGPKTNLFLAFARVILATFLLLGIVRIRFGRKGNRTVPSVHFTVLLAGLSLTLFMSTAVRAGEIPPAAMLDELQKRLLQPADCFPDCADLASMDIRITDGQLTLTLEGSAQIKTFLPLPGSSRHWLPRQVTIDNQSVEGLFRVSEQLMVLFPPGRHTITMEGRLPDRDSLQLPLPLKPHLVTSDADGWTIEGMHEDGRVDNQIILKRITQGNTPAREVLETGILPPFLQIERTLHLGLSWKITTTVKRLSAPGNAIVFDYPLLPGESILTENIRSRDRAAQITLDAQQTTLRWESALRKSTNILLRHRETTLWTEIWQVDASPVFHLETSGIPVIFHQRGNRWYPTWHPWPGEEVRLTIIRPAGIKGQTMTIERSHLEIHPGRRATENTLTLKLRSSQGGRHTIRLPENALLQEVRINGEVQPVRQEDRQVPLPIRPGLQEILLNWQAPTGMTTMYRTPRLDLGMHSVNASIDVFLPPNRWPLFLGGPLMGPAVLFWSVVLILLLISFGLARTGLTPLRFHQWFLFGIGLSQSNIAAGLLVVGWLMALDLRGRAQSDMDHTVFNLIQVGLGILTVLASGTLVGAIGMGLLGHPDMNIVGNGSHSGLLRWYQDLSGPTLPQAWILSIPMFVYRLTMLAWALWISFALISLLKWGWHNYSSPVLWHKIPRRKRTLREKTREGRPESAERKDE